MFHIVTLCCVVISKRRKLSHSLEVCCPINAERTAGCLLNHAVQNEEIYEAFEDDVMWSVVTFMLETIRPHQIHPSLHIYTVS